MKVLLVDDSSTMRKIIRRALTEVWPETEVVEAEDGAVAGDVLAPAEHGVGLILLDFNLPGENGLAVLERLKGDERLREIPVVMVTVESEKASVIRALHAGAGAYVTKPFDEADLRKRLEPYMKS